MNSIQNILLMIKWIGYKKCIAQLSPGLMSLTFGIPCMCNIQYTIIFKHRYGTPCMSNIQYTHLNTDLVINSNASNFLVSCPF